MLDRERGPETLVVRRRHGVLHFAITWHSGRRRHTVSLGSERDGWTEQKARDVLGPARRRRPPRRLREIELPAEIAKQIRELREAGR
jgi:hypothetical protein